MSRISNRQLVEELKSGHRMGGIHLVQIYQRKLIAECIRSFRLDPLDAEEIVDDVFVSVIQKIHQFTFKRSESDFHFWLMTVFRNRVRDFIRRETMGSIRPVIAVRSGSLMEDRASVRAAIRIYECAVLGEDESAPERRLLAIVVDLLNELQPWERVLLQCRALNVPYGDIARYTGKTCEQLKVYHARVQLKFKRLLAKRFPEITSDYETSPSIKPNLTMEVRHGVNK
ncbi:MAG: sigma-70 family RNA polymerase sigma factor [Ignavibacteriales bacterium]|nr:sigma-70 family RNA polymerase sigma factor [Ignavibacteriales bacterium]